MPAMINLVELYDATVDQLVDEGMSRADAARVAMLHIYAQATEPKNQAPEDPAFDLNTIIKPTHVFIQWKGTEACLDFHCDCGAHHHIDAGFLYAIQCHKCKTIWEMPSNLFPRKVTTYQGTPYLTKDYDECGNEILP